MSACAPCIRAGPWIHIRPNAKKGGARKNPDAPFSRLGGFEPPTSCPPDKHAKPLRYSPVCEPLSYRWRGVDVKIPAPCRTVALSGIGPPASPSRTLRSRLTHNGHRGTPLMVEYAYARRADGRRCPGIPSGRDGFGGLRGAVAGCALDHANAQCSPATGPGADDSASPGAGGRWTAPCGMGARSARDAGGYAARRLRGQTWCTRRRLARPASGVRARAGRHDRDRHGGPPGRAAPRRSRGSPCGGHAGALHGHAHPLRSGCGHARARGPGVRRVVPERGRTTHHCRHGARGGDGWA